MNKIPSVQQLIFDIYHSKGAIRNIKKLKEIVSQKYNIPKCIGYTPFYEDGEETYHGDLLEDIISLLKEFLEKLMLLKKENYNHNLSINELNIEFFRHNSYYTLYLVSNTSSLMYHYGKYGRGRIEETQTLCLKAMQYNFTKMSKVFSTCNDNQQIEPFFQFIIEDTLKLFDFNVSNSPPIEKIQQLDKVENEVIKELIVEKIIEVEKQVPMNIFPSQSQIDIKEQLLQQLKQLTPTQFEHFSLYLISIITEEKNENIKDLAIHNGQVGDGGVDGVFEMKNKLGTYDKYVIQCKRYNRTSIGTPELRNFVGAMADYQIKQGLFITTSKFSKNVSEYIEKVKHSYSISIMDGMKLVEYMIEHNIGIHEVTHIEKVIDLSFFNECKYQLL